MAFWFRVKNDNKYIYLRYSEYIRDKRTLKRKPRSQGKGDYNPNKYIKKKDIYLGKLTTLENPKQIIFFDDYLKNIGIKDKNDFLNNNSYDKIFDIYLKYLFELYNIDEIDFFNKDKLIVYETSNGYISKRMLDWVHSFIVNQNNFLDEKEIQRFTIRCEYLGILDLDIINALYSKICPEINEEENLKELNKEIDKLKKDELKRESYKNVKDFLQSN